MIHSIYRAAWADKMDVSDRNVLLDILKREGVDNGEELLAKTETKEIKEKLVENTTRAKEAGAFGVPSFQINGGNIIFGQDRFSTIQDFICGWSPSHAANLINNSPPHSRL